MEIAPDLLEEIVEHARRDAPNECCGLLGVRDGRVTSVHAAENIHASPFRFELGSQEQLALYTAIEDAGEDIGAIYHSHTRSEPVPSQTDVTMAGFWPGLEWLIVGLAGDEPDVRSYLIDGAKVDEVPVRTS